MTETLVIAWRAPAANQERVGQTCYLTCSDTGSLIRTRGMSNHLHQEPTPDQLAAIAAYRPDGPLVALNLNRHRRRAAIEHAVLLWCHAGPEPVLTSPFGT
jgi:hypothetical protein